MTLSPFLTVFIPLFMSLMIEVGKDEETYNLNILNNNNNE